jgi:hypothetical protein
MPFGTIDDVPDARTNYGAAEGRERIMAKANGEGAPGEG